MTFRHGPRVRGAAKFFTTSPRRVAQAFGLGLGLSVAGLAAWAAGARGNFVMPDAAPSEPPTYAAARAERSDSERITFVHYERHEGRRRHVADDDEDYRPHRHHAKLQASGIHFATLAPVGVAGAQPVCVRLCDGYFFPLPTSASDVASQGQACNSLCPDAPTEVYYRNGSEDIGAAVSATGKLYSALPVSMRYRTTSDETCTCHHSTVAYAPLRDPTLRHGDAIMTPAGFMVFRGVEGAPHGAGDFSAVDTAGLDKGERGALKEMERASLQPAHPTLRDWLLSQNAGPAMGPQAAARAPTQVAASAGGANKIRLLSWR